MDIEPCGDVGGGFNVGWIVDGEWLQYAVDTEAGTYDITARVASGGAAVGDLRVLLDGAVLGTIDVGSTGGWQTYADLSLRGIPDSWTSFTPSTWSRPGWSEGSATSATSTTSSTPFSSRTCKT